MVDIELDLGEVEGIYFLVAHLTGVTYTHQCGGYSCAQNAHQGFLVPQPDSNEVGKELYRYFFTGPKYRGGCSNGIDAQDADFIDRLLNLHRLEWIHVDRSRLKVSREAWIHMALKPDVPCFPMCYGSDPRSEIVMIWENSD